MSARIVKLEVLGRNVQDARQFTVAKIANAQTGKRTNWSAWQVPGKRVHQEKTEMADQRENATALLIW